jgi:purine-binding chemotaxis protein CheW
MSAFSRRRSVVREKSLVGFEVGGVRYAVDIMRVREVVNPLPIVPLPHAPDEVLGVADHRGQVVPVLDLRRRFRLPPKDEVEPAKWIVVLLRGLQVALVADAVTEVFGVNAADQRPEPHVGGDFEARGIAAVYAVDGELVFVLDIDRVAAPATRVDV